MNTRMQDPSGEDQPYPLPDHLTTVEMSGEDLCGIFRLLHIGDLHSVQAPVSFRHVQSKVKRLCSY